jgi:lycopene beta-cyclase
MKHYHYIFTGSGLAALMTVYKMAVSGKFNDTSILLIDADTKKTNDRTWCFWEEGAGRWDEIVCKKWKSALFANERFTKELDFGNYQYKMVQGLDFYNYVFATLSQHPNIEFVNAGVIDFSDSGRQVLVKTESGNYTCNKLFNSIYNPASVQVSTLYCNSILWAGILKLLLLLLMKGEPLLWILACHKKAIPGLCMCCQLRQARHW